eukprot:jgi/Ulvmu1/164/UM001_0168.1
MFCRKPAKLILLALGQQGSGKSTCLRCLMQGWQAHSECKPCQPTTGVESWNILKRLRVTEVGSAVGGLWLHYVPSCTGGLLYFIDVTAKSEISCAAMELHSVIAHESFVGPKKLPVIIVLTHCDQADEALPMGDIGLLLGLESLQAAGLNFQIVEVTSTLSSGYDPLVEALHARVLNRV